MANKTTIGIPRMNFVALLVLSLFGVVISAPLDFGRVSAFGNIEGRALPTPVDAATARTYLASCKLFVACLSDI